MGLFKKRGSSPSDAAALRGGRAGKSDRGGFFPGGEIAEFTVSCGELFSRNYYFDGRSIEGWNEDMDSYRAEDWRFPADYYEHKRVVLTQGQIQDVCSMLKLIPIFLPDDRLEDRVPAHLQALGRAYSCRSFRAQFKDGRTVDYGAYGLAESLFFMVFFSMALLCPLPEAARTASDPLPGECITCRRHAERGLPYCGECGRRLSDDGAPAALFDFKNDTLGFCPVCGRDNPAHHKYCVYCGSSMSTWAVPFERETSVRGNAVNLRKKDERIEEKSCNM